jgi:hypothetical protein
MKTTFPHCIALVSQLSFDEDTVNDLVLNQTGKHLILVLLWRTSSGRLPQSCSRAIFGVDIRQHHDQANSISPQLKSAPISQTSSCQQDEVLCPKLFPANYAPLRTCHCSHPHPHPQVPSITRRRKTQRTTPCSPLRRSPGLTAVSVLTCSNFGRGIYGLRDVLAAHRSDTRRVAEDVREAILLWRFLLRHLIFARTATRCTLRPRHGVVVHE